MLMQSVKPHANDAESNDLRDDDGLVTSDGHGGAPYGPKSGHRITPQQKAFARAYVTNGGNQTAAAAAAGYKSTGPSGCKLMANSSVLAEIKRLSVLNIEAKLPSLIARAVAIAENPKTSPELAIKTIFSLMDRAGLKPKSGPLVQITDNSVHNTDARQVNVSPQEVLRQLDAARERRLSGISASMTDNPPQYDALPSNAIAAGEAPTQGGGVDQGPADGPDLLPGISDAQAPEPGENP